MTHNTTCGDHPVTESCSTTLLREMNTDAAIGQHLRMLREIAGLKLEALAERTGLPQEELDDHEHGLMPLPLTQAVILAETLEIDLSVIVDSAAWAWRLSAREKTSGHRDHAPPFPGC